MAGNIANPQTYIKYAEAGIDYCRCGIGGSHCMVIVGYDDNFAIKHNLKLKNNLCGGYFKIANSWGKEWGNNGFCYVPYELIEDMHDLWAVKEGGKNGLFNSIINVVSNIISNSFKK